LKKYIKKHVSNYIIIILFSLAPIIATYAAYIIADLNGFKTTEVASDNGSILVAMSQILIWAYVLAIFTIPFGVLLLIINTCTFIFEFMKEKKALHKNEN